MARVKKVLTLYDWGADGTITLADRKSSILEMMFDSAKSAKVIRLGILVLGIGLWFCLILIRLVQLQVFKHPEFVQLANQQQQITREILAPRGVIYDSRMDELATSVTVSTVVAEPRKIGNIPETAQILASILGLDPQDLTQRMQDPARRRFMIIKRRIDPEAEKRIESLDLKGVYFLQESMRVYPNRDLACQTLGFVNLNGDGGAGIELQYDRELQGKKGLFSFEVDARRQSFRIKVEKAPVQGHSLVLSLDKSIQYIADRELAAAVQKFQARAGTVIIIESDTGRILALSNYPRFNCNTYNQAPAELWRNRAVTDIFEPGSTFKVVVSAAALEAGLVQPEEMIDCQMGTIAVAGHLFHDHHRYGLLNFKQILELSSNVGAVKLGLRLGRQRLYEALRKFGFGSKSGVDLPGEIVGLVRDWRNWSNISIGAISFGQEVGVTSIQILNAINAIANGGYLVRPSIVDRIINENGDLVSVRTPERVRIISPRTAEVIAEAFEGVVLRGTGRRAALEGYRAAGKTGTAQKIVDGRYSDTKYVASFIGFAPLPHPRITVLVQIDEPKGSYYGGEVCAPYFKKIAQESLLQLRVPPDRNLTAPASPPLNIASNTKYHLRGNTPIRIAAGQVKNQEKETRPQTLSIEVAEDWIVLPDFRGQAKRRVMEKCMELGIHLQSNGSGIAIYQYPAPGTRVPLGTMCSVTFGRNKPKEPPSVAEARAGESNTGPKPSPNIRP